MELTLIKEHVTNEIIQADKFVGYRPLFEEEPEEPRHKNYLYGMVYPKIGTQGEYYHYNEADPFSKNEGISSFKETDAVVANYRYSYVEGG